MHSFETQLTSVAIPVARTTLHGRLHFPSDASALVLFAHGGGSSQLNPRNQRIAESLHDVGLATLLLGLLPETAQAGAEPDTILRNDIALLAERLRAAERWARHQPELAALPLGYLGSGDGGAAAMLAAASGHSEVGAVVTRSARAGLTNPALLNLKVPTMLIAGGNDDTTAALNLEIWARLRCEKSIEIVPGAGHRFEEPGALDNVAALAARWFSTHLQESTAPS